MKEKMYNEIVKKQHMQTQRNRQIQRIIMNMVIDNF